MMTGISIKRAYSLANYIDEQLLAASNTSKSWGDIADALMLEKRDQAFWKKTGEISEEHKNTVAEYNPEIATFISDKIMH